MVRRLTPSRSASQVALTGVGARRRISSVRACSRSVRLTTAQAMRCAPAGSGRQEGAQPDGQRGDDDRVGVFKELGEQAVGKRGRRGVGEVDSDPVPFVHVVTGGHLRVPLEEGGRVVGVGLDGDLAVLAGQVDQREDLPADLEDRGVLAERVAPLRLGQGRGPFQELPSAAHGSATGAGGSAASLSGVPISTGTPLRSVR